MRIDTPIGATETFRNGLFQSCEIWTSEEWTGGDRSTGPHHPYEDGIIEIRGKPKKCGIPNLSLHEMVYLSWTIEDMKRSVNAIFTLNMGKSVVDDPKRFFEVFGFPMDSLARLTRVSDSCVWNMVGSPLY